MQCGRGKPGGQATPTLKQVEERFSGAEFGNRHHFGQDRSRACASDEDERTLYLKELGLKEPGLNRLIAAGYRLLGLITYFTAGPKETRAWTITRGTTAPGAAGVIHSDFEKGFIRAETIAYRDFVSLGGEAGSKEAGEDAP